MSSQSIMALIEYKQQVAQTDQQTLINKVLPGSLESSVAYFDMLLSSNVSNLK